MILFIKKLLGLCHPYRIRLFWAVVTGLLAGIMEPLLSGAVALVIKVVFPTVGSTTLKTPGFLAKHPWLQNHLDSLTGWTMHFLPQNSRDDSTAIIALAVCLIPVVMFLRGLFTYLNIYLLQWVSVRAITDFRTKVFSHILNLPLSFLSKMSTGEIMSRIGGDTGSLQNVISNSLVVIIKDPATLLALLVGLLIAQPMLTLVSLLVVPLCAIPISVYSRKTRKSSRAIQNEFAEISKVMHESFTGNRIIKAYNLESNVIQQFKNASGKYIGHYMRIVRSLEIPGPMIEFFGALGLTLILLYVLLIAHARPDAAETAFFMTCVFQMYRPIKSLTRLHSQLTQAQASSERVFELLNTVSTLPEPTNPVPLTAKGADIQFSNVEFSYDAKPVLRDFSLTIKAGQMVALVGQTGSGKTTVTNLLLRFYDPQKGAVRIGGVDVRAVTTAALREQIAVVTQETLLFDESIRRNIELGRPGATEAEIVQAAKHAHAEEFILDKPHGYDTLIGERGVMISGGQKQRLAIARAIVKNAPILILDEATSALDTKVERAVQMALEEMMVGRTTLCIAHRLSTIQRADVIVVMDQGKIVEMGKHEELLAKNGFYRRLYELQFQT